METIFTTAPISLDLLKRKFTEDIEFVIDYKDSKFKNKILITYLSNLEIKCKLKLVDLDESLELLEAYVNSAILVNIPELEDTIINLLLAKQNKPNFLSFNPRDFIDKNNDILSLWMKRIFQLPAYALYCQKDEYKQIALEYPEDDNNLLTGINYVNLIKHPLFTVLLEGYTEKDITFNKFLFEEYIFKGKCLFDYFSNKNNPLFLAIIANKEQLSELLKMGISELQQLETIRGEQHNVPSLQ